MQKHPGGEVLSGEVDSCGQDMQAIGTWSWTPHTDTNTDVTTYVLCAGYIS